MHNLCAVLKAGFAYFESAFVRSKNCTSALFRNYFDSSISNFIIVFIHVDIIIKVILSAISTASFFLIGYGLAFGGESNGFCGTKYFALVGLPDEKLADAFFQFSFAAAAGTIVSGVVHERCTMTAYFCYTALISGTTNYILLSNF